MKPPSPTTVPVATTGKARTSTPIRTATERPKRSVAGDTEDPHVIALERGLLRHEGWMGTLAVDRGGAVPQPQRVDLARAGSQDHDPAHVIGVDHLLDHSVRIKGAGDAGVAGERPEAGRIARHERVVRRRVRAQERGRL